MPHRLELFSGGCPLCTSFQREIEAGKCGRCEFKVTDVHDPSSRSLMEEYGIRVVPTLIVDGRIKVEGSLDSPWICDDDFYARLEATHGLPNARLR